MQGKKMIRWKLGASAAVAVMGALSLSACATKDYVNKQVEPINALAEANQAGLANTQSQLSSVDGKVAAHDARLAGLDAATREAMERATAAGKLAEGKFLYSVVLSDDGVKFPVSGTKLSSEAENRLAGLAEKLKADNRSVYLEIQGFTDTTGSPQTNERIAQNRADAVRKYLSTQGVPLSRMNTIGYGEENPVADNKTRTGRAQNRRVVVVVLS
jgi:peptidoglycan-associated lipoprotein